MFKSSSIGTVFKYASSFSSSPSTTHQTKSNMASEPEKSNLLDRRSEVSSHLTISDKKKAVFTSYAPVGSGESLKDTMLEQIRNRATLLKGQITTIKMQLISARETEIADLSSQLKRAVIQLKALMSHYKAIATVGDAGIAGGAEILAKGGNSSESVSLSPGLMSTGNTGSGDDTVNLSIQNKNMEFVDKDGTLEISSINAAGLDTGKDDIKQKETGQDYRFGIKNLENKEGEHLGSRVETEKSRSKTSQDINTNIEMGSRFMEILKEIKEALALLKQKVIQIENKKESEYAQQNMIDIQKEIGPIENAINQLLKPESLINNEFQLPPLKIPFLEGDGGGMATSSSSAGIGTHVASANVHISVKV